MKGIFSPGFTSTYAFILGIIAILAIAIASPGMAQAVLGTAVAQPSPGAIGPGISTMSSDIKSPVVNPGGLADTGIYGTVGIGIANPLSPLHISSTTSTQPETIDLSGVGPMTAQWNNYYSGSSAGSGFLARFARGTKGAEANVLVGDRLGFIVFGGWAGGAFRHTAGITGAVDNGTVSATSLPTYLAFTTTPNGSVSRAERMRITSAGAVGVGTTSPHWVSRLHVINDNATDSARAIYGESTAGSGRTYGVYGYSSSSSADSSGVYGESSSGSGVSGRGEPGVIGQSADMGETGYLGKEGYAVYGQSTSSGGYGVYGINSSGGNVGYLGFSNWGAAGINSNGNYGQLGTSDMGVNGRVNGSGYTGVQGFNATGNNQGKLGTDKYGVMGQAGNSNCWAGSFYGSVNITDNLTVVDNLTVGSRAAIGMVAEPNSTLQVLGSFATAFASKDANYTATASDNVIAVDASEDEVTITLPTAVDCIGRTYTIKKIDSAAIEVIVDGAGSETIDGALSKSMTVQWKFITVVSDGANWLIVGEN